jgi:ATP-binding cassette subfamily B protein
MLEAMDAVPGRGVPFDQVARVLGIVLTLYVLSALLLALSGWIVNATVTRTVRDLRGQVEEKLHRVPLSYFDAQPRGELLSRVTNDIDNLGLSLQQTLGPLLHSLASVIGILVMMLLVSPLLTLIALVSIPLSVVVTAFIARRSEPKFIQQWTHTGELNGQVEEALTGHQLVTVFGRRRQVIEAMSRTNRQLFEATFDAHRAGLGHVLAADRTRAEEDPGVQRGADAHQLVDPVRLLRACPLVEAVEVLLGAVVEVDLLLHLREFLDH